MDREMMHLRDSLIPRYAEMIYYGYWFSPEREALQAMIDKSQEKVTGTVRVKLYKGNCVPLGRKSPFSMYSPELATFEEDYIYDQSDAEGFIKLVGLGLKGRMQQSKWGGKDTERYLRVTHGRKEDVGRPIRRIDRRIHGSVLRVGLV